jgi:hypothetical protein
MAKLIYGINNGTSVYAINADTLEIVITKTFNDTGAIRNITSFKDRVYISFSGGTRILDSATLDTISATTAIELGNHYNATTVFDNEYAYSVYEGSATIRKIKLSDFSVEAFYTGFGIMQGLAIDDDYIYTTWQDVPYPYTRRIRKLNKSDLSYVMSGSTSFNNYACNSMFELNGYIFIHSYYSVYNVDFILKIKADDLSYIKNQQVGGSEYINSHVFECDGESLYIAYTYFVDVAYPWRRNGVVVKYNTELVSLAATTRSLPATTIVYNVRGLSSNSLYKNYRISGGTSIYLSTATAISLSKYSLSDLSTEIENYNIGNFEMLSANPFDVGLLPPTNLQFVSGSTTKKEIGITWQNNTFYGDYLIVQWKDLTSADGGDWINSENLAIGTSGYTITNLRPQTYYEIRVVLVGSWYPSVSIFTTTLPALPSFCENAPFTVSGSTCGNADGKISIIEVDYFDYYDFTLINITGGTYTFNESTGEATGLTSGFYFLTATVKPAYWYYYGKETCEFEWLEVEDSDTTMSNTSVSIRNAVCGGFGKSQGRIAYLCADSGSNAPYTAKLYDKDTRDLILTVTGNTIDRIIFAPLNPSEYYCQITNNDGCSLLLGSTQVKGESMGAVAGIKKLWLTQWVNTVEYDYWKQSDEDYYLSGLDSNFFNSIKIKRFIDSTLPDIWYEVNVQTKGIAFQQVMDKTKQGFVFTDKLVLTIPQAENAKWKELVDVLLNRYILVFLDNNGYYWVMGYRHGAGVDGYRRENNEYILEFNAVSENKILTNIDKQYIKDSIL